MNSRYAFFVVGMALLSISLASSAAADPLPGEILKFRQLPLNNGALPAIPPITTPGAPYPGHDELSTAVFVAGQNFYQGTYMADDFADKFDTPVVHVRWWGSYLNPIPAGGGGVKQFLISFENDVPVGTNNPLPYSHPGTERFNQIVRLGPLAPGSGTFTEKLVPTPILPGGVAPAEALYEYNAELHLGREFRQKPDEVNWLKIVALVNTAEDGDLRWGWHNRDWSIPDPLASSPPAVTPGEGPVGVVVVPGPPAVTTPVYHFQDDAVTGPVGIAVTATSPLIPTVFQDSWTPTRYTFPLDGPDGIQQFSKDLAFELYTRVPEPGSLLLIMLATIGISVGARRR